MTPPANPTPDRDQPPRFAYENPSDLAWAAQLLRTARRRRLLRLAAEERAAVAGRPTSQLRRAHDGGSDDA